MHASEQFGPRNMQILDKKGKGSRGAARMWCLKNLWHVGNSYVCDLLLKLILLFIFRAHILGEPKYREPRERKSW